MKHVILSYLKQVSGATAIEYCMVAAGIALAIAAIVYSIGGETLGLYNLVLDEF